MTSEKQITELRHDLNSAINASDMGAIDSYIHQDFTAKVSGGQKMDRKAIMRQIEAISGPEMYFRSEINVEDVEVIGDHARLRVRRTEEAEYLNSRQKGMMFFLAGMMAFLAFLVVVRAEEWTAIRISEVVLLFVACLVFIWLARRSGPRRHHRVYQSREDWLHVDGRWQLVEEELIG